MEDPLKIYSDILAIAYEEFDEDKINRDSDGKFAPKDGGDAEKSKDDDSSNTKFVKIGGSRNTQLDKFIDLDKEEEEIENVDVNDIGEDETYRDYLERKGGFRNTTYNYEDVEVPSLSKGSQEFEYMIKDLTVQEQQIMRKKRFQFWRDQQGSDGVITSTIGKNYSNRIAIDADELTKSVRSYAKYNDKQVVDDQRNYTVLEHQIEDDLKGSFKIESKENGAEISVSLGGFSPDGITEKDDEGRPLIRLNLRDRGYGGQAELSKEDFDKFVKKNDIKFVSKKSGMNWDGKITLNARDVNSIQPLMPFVTQQLERNKFKIREQKKNYDALNETEEKLSEMFDFTVSRGSLDAERTYTLKNSVQGELNVSGTFGGMGYSSRITIDTMSGSDPEISVGFPYEYERQVVLLQWDKENPTARSRSDPKFKRNKVLEGVFGNGMNDRTIKEIEALTPIVKKQVEVQEEFERKVEELKQQQNDTIKKHREELMTVSGKTSMSFTEREAERDRIRTEIDKKTSLRNEIEPELEPEFEDIGVEEITNDDIDIEYDPRKINLDDIDLDDEQAYA